ncbi:hypothetical protein CISG_09881 [Coccidioides immitis RMSCC 3703]|uniref:Uncharacterized protein n=1 Tax=Coccidioides immitis RMSCC 3703 TaxID=454286 RepID=A0A0J8QKR7_COCIT|nr:hypothetical protein CISG_09881 [Coccidioides immitis RMSCC 3703]
MTPSKRPCGRLLIRDQKHSGISTPASMRQNKITLYSWLPSSGEFLGQWEGRRPLPSGFNARPCHNRRPYWNRQNVAQTQTSLARMIELPKMVLKGAVPDISSRGLAAAVE